MNKRQLITNLEPILSNKEIEVVSKRLNNEHITQTESNYLSRSIRPKLKSAEFVVSKKLLSLLDYRRKKYEREDSLLRKKIVNAVKKHVKNIKAIIVFGSYIRNSHTNYRDIDVMIVLNKKTWKSSAEKQRLKIKIETDIDIETDIHLIAHKDLVSLFSYSPLLQSELENRKVIYGDIQISKKIVVSKKYLYSKLLEAEYAMELKNINSNYIYNALRTCLSIQLFLKQKVDNKLMIKTIETNIGTETADSLINNTANLMQREISLRYLKYLYKNLEKELR